MIILLLVFLFPQKGPDVFLPLGTTAPVDPIHQVELIIPLLEDQ